MRTLALDLGTSTGWAMRSKTGQTQSGVLDLSGSRFEGGGMRYWRFEEWLQSLPCMPDRVVYEEVRRHVGTDAAHIYGGLQATLTSFCEQYGLPYEGVPVGTIKKFITGKGNANKQSVIEAVKSHGFEPADDNEADALALLMYAEAGR